MHTLHLIRFVVQLHCSGILDRRPSVPDIARFACLTARLPY